MIKRIKKYFKEVKIEWGKVTKPSWEEVQGRTGVVVVGTGILAVFLFVVDLIIRKLLNLLL